MKIIGVLLIVVGIVALAYKGFTYTKQRTVLDVGPIEAKVDEKKTVPISPIVGVISLAAGVALVVAQRQRV